jgi:hypothetical protein
MQERQNGWGLRKRSKAKKRKIPKIIPQFSSDSDSDEATSCVGQRLVSHDPKGKKNAHQG